MDYIRTKRGQKALVHNGRTFRFQQVFQNGNKRWICRSSKCNKSLITSSDESTIIKEQIHTCAPDEGKIVVAKLRAHSLKRCLQESTPIPTIHKEIFAAALDRGIVVPPFKSTRSTMYKLRKLAQVKLSVSEEKRDMLLCEKYSDMTENLENLMESIEEKKSKILKPSASEDIANEEENAVPQTQDKMLKLSVGEEESAGPRITSVVGGIQDKSPTILEPLVSEDTTYEEESVEPQIQCAMSMLEDMVNFKTELTQAEQTHDDVHVPELPIQVESCSEYEKLKKEKEKIESECVELRELNRQLQTQFLKYISTYTQELPIVEKSCTECIKMKKEKEKIENEGVQLKELNRELQTQILKFIRARNGEKLSNKDGQG